MTDRKHTPGPWDAGQDDHNICAMRNGRRELVAMISHDITGRSRIGQSGCGEEHQEVHANARLIAAAPDLLEVLEEITNRHPTIAQIEQARAAIVKATGCDHQTAMGAG